MGARTETRKRERYQNRGYLMPNPPIRKNSSKTHPYAAELDYGV